MTNDARRDPPSLDSRLPSASVVVAAYNAEATLRDCIASLLALDYPEDRLELIVVDNDSSDGTGAIIAGSGNRITGLRESRRGAAAARNQGLAIARGEVVAFTDADCAVDRGWLRSLTAALADPVVGVAGGSVLARRPCTPLEHFGEAIHDQALAMRESPPYAISANWASPRSLLTGLGGFHEELRRGQDVDLAYRIVRAGYRLRYVDEAVVYHRNPATFVALFRKGCQHGRGAQSLRRIHGDELDAVAPTLRPVQRIARDLAHLRRGHLRTAIYWLVFDLGKVYGELTEHAT